MRSSLLIGRFGPLMVSLNYTWLFITVLGLWGLAFSWLPQNFPQWSNGQYWLTAVLVMGLYLLSLIARELLRAAVAGFNRRGLILYPFGAASPYNIDDMGTGRMILSVFAALFSSFALGGLLLLWAGMLQDGNSLAGLGRAILIPLGWFNIWVGLINLVPGIPFDGGRALTNTLYWFSDERERGLGFTRTVGEMASLGFVLVGAWIGLTSQDWLTALALVVIGWGAREAEEKGKQLNILRAGLSEIKARDVMEEASAEDLVPVNWSIADMVHAHPYYQTDRPLPVMANGAGSGGTEGGMVGLVTLSEADGLLQGTWPTTPVTSIMQAPSEVVSFAPDTPLSDIIELIEERGGNPDEQPAVPVIGDGKLLGSIDPSRLAAFERAEFELGSAELPVKGGMPGVLSRLKGIIPALTVVVAVAILGNIAVNSDPYSYRNTRLLASNPPITFSQTLPTSGTVIQDGTVDIEGLVVSVQPVTSATLSLDGNPLQVTVTGVKPSQQLVTARVTGVKDGVHTIALVAADRLGRIGHTSWQFWAGSTGTPTPAPGADAVQVLQRLPSTGRILLAGSPVDTQLLVSWPQGVAEATLSVDGKDVSATVEPVSGVDNQYKISASLTNVEVGTHVVRASIKGSTGGLYVTEWTFSAAVPDAQNVYFKETGYFVAADFYSFWNTHGGVDIFGYPISDRVRETDPASGETYIAQYFQRARFEIHPASGDKVVLGRLGISVQKPDPAATPSAGDAASTHFFPQTGHNLSGQFLQFWQTRGGLDIFGYPTTEVRVETSTQDGKQYMVQYFERARFELHPEFAGTPYEVQLGQLGAIVYGTANGAP